MATMINDYLEPLAYIPRKTSDSKYIDVSFTSEDSLGVKLAPIFGRKFKTHVGVVGSVKNYLDFISKPGYPIELLDKTRLTKQQRDSIPKSTEPIKNYWSYVAYSFSARILQDKELYDELRNNTLDFTSYSFKSKSVLFGEPIEIGAPNKGMRYYLAILRLISQLIKSETFNDVNIEKLICSCRDNDEPEDAVATLFVKRK